MTQRPGTVSVNMKWLQDVEVLLRSLRQAIKETGLPRRPGVFSVELSNQLEVQLEGLIHAINIDKAIEEALKEQAEAADNQMADEVQANAADPTQRG